MKEGLKTFKSDKPYKEGFLCTRVPMTDAGKKRIQNVLEQSGLSISTFAYSAFINECEKYETACREGKLYQPTKPKKY